MYKVLQIMGACSLIRGKQYLGFTKVWLQQWNMNYGETNIIQKMDKENAVCVCV